MNAGILGWNRLTRSAISRVRRAHVGAGILGWNRIMRSAISCVPRAHVDAGILGWNRITVSQPMHLESLCIARDPEPTLVVGAVTGTAAQDDVRRIVRATVGAMHDVMQFEFPRRTATIDTTAAAIAPTNEPRHRGRNVLIRALRCIPVDRADVLGIAQRTLNDDAPDWHLNTGSLLPALATTLAHDHRDLVLRATGMLGTRHAFEHSAAHPRDERVVGQVGTVLVVEYLASLTEQREGLGFQLEPDDLIAHHR